jgi:Tfp pilus assembly protein FimT
LMVVVVLIGIMAGMIIPEMKGTYEDALLRSASRELVGVCNTASSRAISLNQLLRVRLDKDTGRYALERKTGEGISRNAFIAMKDVPGGEGKLDTRISVTIRKSTETDNLLGPDEATGINAPEEGRLRGGGETIVFYPDGTAEAGEIRLEDRSGFRLALRINPVTARVRIVELGRQ